MFFNQHICMFSKTLWAPEHSHAQAPFTQMFPILYAGLIQGQRERDVAAGTWTQFIHLIEMTLNMSSRTLLGTGLLTSLLSRSFLMIKEEPPRNYCARHWAKGGRLQDKSICSDRMSVLTLSSSQWSKTNRHAYSPCPHTDVQTSSLHVRL